MVNTITPQNINDVLNEVIKKLDEAKGLVANPGCSSPEVGQFRNKVLNSLTDTIETVTDVIHKTYIL